MEKLLLTIYNKQDTAGSESVLELYLPNINNRSLALPLPGDALRMPDSQQLSLEVWNEAWEVVSSPLLHVFAGGVYQPRFALQPGGSFTLRAAGTELLVIAAQAIAGQARFVKYNAFGATISIGSEPDNHICCSAGGLVSGHHAVLRVDAGGAGVLEDLNSTNGSFVNGHRIAGAQALNYGDVISLMGQKLVFLGGVLAVSHVGEGCLVQGLHEYVPPAPAPAAEQPLEDEFYQRSPRALDVLNTEDISIDPPPQPASQRRQPLLMTIGPSLTMVIPMALGVLFTMMNSAQGGSGSFAFMGIITSGAAAVIGVFWGLMNYRYNLKMEKEAEQTRRSAYSAYLGRMQAELEARQQENRQVLEYKYPFTHDCLRWTALASRRLWERNVNHSDFLTIRLGLGQVANPYEIVIPKERFSLIGDDLAQRPLELRQQYGTMPAAPVCFSLLEHPLVGVVAGDDTLLQDVAQVMISQLAAYHSYTDLRMVFLYDAERLPRLDFVRWLPHSWDAAGKVRMVAVDRASTGEVLYELFNTIRTRQEGAAPGGGQDKRALPHHVVFVANPELLEEEPVMKYITEPGEVPGLSTVLLYGSVDRLPNNCTDIIENSDDYKGYYSIENAYKGIREVQFDQLAEDRLAEFARTLSGIKVRELSGAGSIPTLLTFLDMYKTTRVEDVDITRRWLENRSYESMQAMVGYKAGSQPLYLDLHEKYHGPHGLVAGTTGSGKSETLQSYILSMAINYHPHEVSFILIDYKGGGMADSFTGLPHVAGIITNLGGNQTGRALASINSEIKRRQAIFKEYKLKHIDGYIELFRAGAATKPLPHLIIIADEFAELKKEQPEFVRALVSASRVGRSLGVHLILATQKPGGVVDEEIWGNSKFRLCLRVQDKQDSNEMLHRTDAAYITNPGAGFFQVGNDEIFEEFQSGWSGAAYEPEIDFTDDKNAEVRMINLWGKPRVIADRKKSKAPKTEGGKKQTQLEAVVRYIRSIAEKQGVQAINDIWLPPLPRSLALDALDAYAPVEEAAAFGLPVEIGVVDDPTRQRQVRLSYNVLESGHTLLVGPSGSGKTTLLQTMLYTLATRYTPAQVQFYIADFGSKLLSVFGRLPHTGGLVFEDTPDRADKLLRLLMAELARRKNLFAEKGVGVYKEYARNWNDLPALLFVVDNYAAYADAHPGHEDNLIVLSREAAGYGIYLVFACSNQGDLRSRLRQHFAYGIGLQLADKFEYESVTGEKGDVLAEEKTPGRGLVRFPNLLEFQTALCVNAPDAVQMNTALQASFAAIADAWDGPLPRPIPEVPEDMHYAAFLAQPALRGVDAMRYLPLGYDLTEAALVSADLQESYCFAISGDGRTGKTNLLKVLAAQAAAAGGKVYLFDGPGGELEAFAGEIGAADIAADADGLYRIMSEVMVPAFSARNAKRAQLLAQHGAETNALMLQEEKIFLFINDFRHFIDCVYNAEKQMSGFIEQCLKKGAGHGVWFFACFSPGEYADMFSRAVYQLFVGWKTGIHLGGMLDSQRVFDFDVPAMERGKRTPPGKGHLNDGGTTRRVVTPEY